jgi:hypothetical protein
MLAACTAKLIDAYILTSETWENNTKKGSKKIRHECMDWIKQTNYIYSSEYDDESSCL